ncbi:MAG: HEAT repeat domain-containing protein [Elusimicrobiales bacterium]|nr:HEAT repeat domain-containing protein [Elusimicrobiales bacterium]
MAVKTVLLILALAPGLCRAQEPSRAELGRKALGLVVSHLKSSDAEVRAQAAEILGAAGNPSASGLLKKLLADKDKYVRIASARALWELGSPSGVKTIYAIINDVPAQGPIPVTNSPLVELKVISQNKVRERAMEALAAMKGKKAADVLFALKNDNYGTIRDAAARELARVGYDEELAQFTDALTSEDEALRYESAATMGKVCSAAAAEPLAALLKTEKSVRVKMAALDALKCNPARKQALAQLLKLADDENPTIKYKAAAALSAIKDPGVKAKLQALAASTQDTRLKITAQRGLVLNGADPDAATARSALLAVSPEVKLEALDVISSFPDDEAVPMLTEALEDVSVQVKLASALQIIKRFSKK